MEKKIITLNDLLDFLCTEYDCKIKKGDSVLFERINDKYYCHSEIMNDKKASALLSYHVNGNNNTIVETLHSKLKCMLCGEEFEYKQEDGLKHTCKEMK